jgi:hypothetical protein
VHPAPLDTDKASLSAFAKVRASQQSAAVHSVMNGTNDPQGDRAIRVDEIPVLPGRAQQRSSRAALSVTALSPRRVVDVVPTVATTQNGRQPSAISPRIAWTKALGIMRKGASVSILRTFS